MQFQPEVDVVTAAKKMLGARWTRSRPDAAGLAIWLPIGAEGACRDDEG